jgi:intein-encoded DNA endonuclease-like protein
VYLVGVLLKGDGSVFISHSRVKNRSGIFKVYSRYAIQLEVSSKEFAAHFNRKCSEMFQRPQLRIRGPDKKGMFFVTYHDRAFGPWWKTQNLDTLRPYIKSFPRDYLRGRFDSEASVHSYSVYLCGAENHRDVMQFDRDLCAELGMRTGNVLIYGKRGDLTYIEGRPIVNTMDRLRFSVNSQDFLDVLGGLAVKERDEDLRSGIKGRNWTPWSAIVRKRAIVLSRNGASTKEISKVIAMEFHVDVPSTTVYFWTRKGTRSWSEFSAERPQTDGD